MLIVGTGRPVLSRFNEIKNEIIINLYLPRIEMILILFPDFFVIRLLDSFRHSLSVFHSKLGSLYRPNMTKSAEGNSVAPYNVIIVYIEVINSRINMCVVQMISSLTLLA